MEPLLQGYIKAIREVVNEAFMVTKGKHRVKWDSPELSKWVTALSERVFTLQEKTDDLIEKIKRADEVLKTLAVSIKLTSVLIGCLYLSRSDRCFFLIWKDLSI